ncbi:hypothetical protein [Yoonia sp.]|uniref:hypothetical protein n=1 Tax=Yoonia sp. TaxID=2212373 RepID=UPI0019FF8B39|nr:hypothetical protein [Yoonia sp.]MBE0412884.1 hypothetical protein [Yoonia sp.]
MSVSGLDDFNSRIKRINSARNTSYFDPELGMNIPKRVSHETIRRTAKAKRPSFKAFGLSVVIGAGAVIVAQVLRLRGLGLTEPGNAALFVDLLLALLIVLTVTGGLRYRLLRYRVAQALGVVAVLGLGHNLMWYYPDQMAVIYSADYVQSVRDTTEPGLPVLQDVTINL